MGRAEVQAKNLKSRARRLSSPGLFCSRLHRCLRSSQLGSGRRVCARKARAQRVHLSLRLRKLPAQRLRLLPQPLSARVCFASRVAIPIPHGTQLCLKSQYLVLRRR